MDEVFRARDTRLHRDVAAEANSSLEIPLAFALDAGKDSPIPNTFNAA